MNTLRRSAHAHVVALRGFISGIAMSSCLAAAAAGGAEPGDPPTGWSLWSSKGDAFSGDGWGQALLRPSASWSRDKAPPQLEFAAGIGHRFASGLSVDFGLSSAQVAESPAINYRDYFLGVRYGSLDSKLWYLPESRDGDATAMYYEAGWSPVLGDRLALSLRLGQRVGGATAFTAFESDFPSVSLGASTHFRGYGVGLSLVDGRGSVFGGDADFRLMGSISRPLR